jgi:hypothetical protein
MVCFIPICWAVRGESEMALPLLSCHIPAQAELGMVDDARRGGGVPSSIPAEVYLAAP